VEDQQPQKQTTRRTDGRTDRQEEEDQAEKTKVKLHLCCSPVSALTENQSAKVVYITTKEVALQCTSEDRN